MGVANPGDVAASLITGHGVINEVPFKPTIGNITV